MLKHLDIQLIRHFQHASGAYPACPSFSQYPHSWLRDGSFIAHAMDRADAHSSARAFHTWVARTLDPYANHTEWLIRQSKAGEPVRPTEMLPARFSLSGEWLRDDGWPNYQLDGYGQWLWSLTQHLEMTHEDGIPEVFRDAVMAVAQYLQTFWREPCSDCWEEKADLVHTSTLASIHGGLKAISGFLPEFATVVEDVRGYILEHCVRDGRFIKSIGDDSVDANLIWVSTPFEVVPPSDPRMLATIAEIERTLVRDGGVIRYAKDEYYGAGAWLLLTDFLAWHLARDHQAERASTYHAWIEQHREATGYLPEQVPVSSTDAARLEHWTVQWGTSASPLLWSHAMHLIAADALGELEPVIHEHAHG